MKIEKQNILTSPSDLKNFTQCKYLTKNDILFLKQEGKGKELKKTDLSEDLNLVIKKGKEHEKKYLKLFTKKYPNYKIIQNKKDEKEQFRETVVAIKEGKEMISQALLMDEDGSLHEAYGTWRMKMNYGKEYMGCARSTFVIGTDGKLTFARYNVKAKGHVAMLLRELGIDG